MEQTSGILSGQQLKDELDKHDWESILITLRGYVLFRLKMKYFINPSAEKRLSGEQVDDIVHKSVASIWLEERKWDINKEPNLLKHLKSVVDSMLYNGIIQSRQFQDQDYKEMSELAEQHEASTDNAEIVNAKLIIELLKDKLRGDEKSLLMFERHFIDGMPPREIVEETGLTISDVNATLRRMKRKLGLIQY